MSEESSGEKVPLWIISFADMITLLLSFFVMLQTMAKTKDAALMGISRESFRRAIAGMGIPDFLFGKGGQLDMDYQKRRHSMEEKPSTEPNPDRVIDVDDEVIRHLFRQIKEEMSTESSDPTQKDLHVFQAPVEFPVGRSDLTDNDKAALMSMVRTLLADATPDKCVLEVLGWAGDEPDARGQWKLSARRAGEVEKYLRSVLPKTDKPWEVASWGVGPGNAKLREMGFVQGKSVILVVVSSKGE